MFEDFNIFDPGLVGDVGQSNNVVGTMANQSGFDWQSLLKQLPGFIGSSPQQPFQPMQPGTQQQQQNVMPLPQAEWTPFKGEAQDSSGAAIGAIASLLGFMC